MNQRDGSSRSLCCGAVYDLIGSVRDGEQLGFRGEFYALRSLCPIMGFRPDS
jgi:hypothetical protein